MAVVKKTALTSAHYPGIDYILEFAARRTVDSHLLFTYRNKRNKRNKRQLIQMSQNMNFLRNYGQVNNVLDLSNVLTQ